MENKLVDEAVVAKVLVLVAEVVVEFEAVKFWRVEEPRTSRLAKLLLPVKALLSARRVEEAAVIVMLAVPSKVVPFMVLEAREIVLAVPPLYEPENESEVLPAVRSAKLDPKAIPEIVELARSVLATVAQVATPRAEIDLVNWLVHEVPAYSANKPSAPVRVRAEVKFAT